MLAPHRELALLLAGTAARRRRSSARIHALAVAANLQAVAAELDRQRLLAILGHRLVEAAATTSAFEALVDDVRRSASLRGMAFEAQTDQVVRALEGSGIDVLRLKGTALSERLYGDPGFRQSHDIDVLVARERLDDSVAALQALGYVRAGGPELPVLQHVLQHPHPEIPDVDLHWRIHWYEDEFARRLLEESSVAADGERLAPATLEFVALLLFYARDGFTGLRFPVDIATFTDVMGSEIDPGEVARIFDRHPDVAVPARAALRVLALLGAYGVGAAGPLSRRQLLAVRVSDWQLENEVDQIVANVHLVDGLLMPPGRVLAFLRMRLLVFESPGANAVHLAKQLARWALALIAIRRRR
jgi:hypothetical protein